MLKHGIAALAALLLVGCNSGESEGGIDEMRLINAGDDSANWITHGRTYSEQRFSPLDAINTGNVNQLGLAFYADLDTRRGQEATPIMVDGVLYTTAGRRRFRMRSIEWLRATATSHEIGLRSETAKRSALVHILT